MKQYCPLCKKEVETEYIPEEPENNVQEDHFCVECGESLDLPEPDWDLIEK